MSALFDLNPPENRQEAISSDELRSIKAAFDDSQLPILCAFRTDIRYQKQTRNHGACALSNHFIGLFEQESVGSDFTCFAMVHISEIELICVSTEKFVYLQTSETKIILTAPDSIKLAQRLYVSCCLTGVQVQVRSDDMSLFPEIDIEKLKVSFSQKFQFVYFSNCVKHGVPYNHEVVRYIHTMMRSANSILNVSHLPLDFSIQEQSNDLLAMLSSLQNLGFVNGICCCDISRPDIFKSIAPLAADDNALRIVHLENCNAGEGLDELANALKFNPQAAIPYWNISKNPLTAHFKSFLNILTYSKSEVLYLNLNDCEITPEDFSELFLVMARNANMWNMRYLHVAGIKLTRFDTFQRFLTKAQKIETLDIGNAGEGLADLIHILVEKKYPLKHLCLRGANLSGKSIHELMVFIKESTTLTSLDISCTTTNAEGAGSLINAVSMNENLAGFDLKIDNTGVNGEGLFPIFRAFLRSDLRKWKALSFNDNGMSAEDIRTLIPLFIRMKNLESLSLSNNFDDTMQAVGGYLVDLLKIPSLVSLTIAGGKRARLGSQLQPLLKAIAKADKLTYLDVSNNSSGDACLSTFVKVIHSCTKLETLIVDGNDFLSADQVATLIDAVEENPTLISFPYPVLDAQAIVKNADSDAKNVIRVLGELEISAVNAINKNRIKRKMPNDLPFTAKPEIADLVAKISHETRKMLREIIPKTHSCVCEEFNIPLPFQKLGETVQDGGQEKTIDIGDLKEYDIESMRRIITEDKKTYQTCICPTMYLTQLLKNAKKSSRKHKTKHHGSSDEDTPPKKRSKRHLDTYDEYDDRRHSKRSKRIEISSSSDEEMRHSKRKSKRHTYDDEEPAPKKSKLAARRILDSDSDEDKQPKKRSSKIHLSSDDRLSKSGRNKRMYFTSDDDDVPKKKHRKYDSSDDDDSFRKQKKTSDDEFQPKYRKRKNHDDSSDEAPRIKSRYVLETREADPSGQIDKLVDMTYRTFHHEKTSSKTKRVRNYDETDTPPPKRAGKSRKYAGPTVTFDFDF